MADDNLSLQQIRERTEKEQNNFRWHLLSFSEFRTGPCGVLLPQDCSRYLYREPCVHPRGAYQFVIKDGTFPDHPDIKGSCAIGGCLNPDENWSWADSDRNMARVYLLWHFSKLVGKEIEVNGIFPHQTHEYIREGDWNREAKISETAWKAWNALIDYFNKGTEPKFPARELVSLPFKWDNGTVAEEETDPVWEDRTRYLHADAKIRELQFGPGREPYPDESPGPRVVEPGTQS